MNNTHKKGFPFAIVLVAVAIVFALSYVGWGELTGDIVKDYDLLADIRKPTEVESVEIPEALQIKEPTSFLPDSLWLVEETSKYEVMPKATSDSAVADESVQLAAEMDPRVNGEMVIEDYTSDQRGLSRLKVALEDHNRPARIAVIGDSYIEGDIFTQDLRQQLQTQFGGQGVGYVPASSQVAGFRRTVGHTNSGWSQHGLPNVTNPKYFPLAGEYFTAAGNANITYKGYAKDPHLASWEISRVLFIAPANGTIKMIADNDTLVAQVEGGPEVQELVLAGHTSKLNISTSVPGMVFLGAWLEDDKGVVLDCMSIRGDSGMAHRNTNVGLAEQMRQYTDYDLIILEYGINALSAQQHNYSAYGNTMVQVVNRIRECYPNADIMMMGIGDRGQKINGTVQSMPTAPNMVAAQREAAQKAQCLFWDTREAMGGANAVADWRNRKLVNGDYIHLNSAGGRELATELVQSINKMLYE